MWAVTGEFEFGRVMNGLSELDGLRAWIGREECGSDLVSPELAKRFCATVDQSASGSIDRIAPLGIHWCLAPPAFPTAELGSDGHPRRGGFLPPVSLPRRMWAGGTLLFNGPIYVGDVVHRRRRVRAISTWMR